MRKKSRVTYKELDRILTDLFCDMYDLSYKALTVDERETLARWAILALSVCVKKMWYYKKAKRRKRKKRFLKKFFGK